ncbi:MAG: cytochrome c maturation protein CcmE [Pseudomonadota bacterium]|nr:cytochrome c maturation protein CcmE [Pseudomonadota bacterium]MDE3037655.1 cytochrome c maturation protein CcmE [Pseudomonadota bacterium]
MKSKHQRLLFIAVSMVFLCTAGLLALRAFRDNLVFFYSPSELADRHIPPNQLVRIGGLVEKGSVVRGDQGQLTFVITDGKSSVSVFYRGLLPQLFREGQGVVAEGRLSNPGHFVATTILAKHDERYMPRDVVEALKRSGRWRATP